jgi:hypothetical protein
MQILQRGKLFLQRGVIVFVLLVSLSASKGQSGESSKYIALFIGGNAKCSAQKVLDY